MAGRFETRPILDKFGRTKRLRDEEGYPAGIALETCGFFGTSVCTREPFAFLPDGGSWPALEAARQALDAARLADSKARPVLLCEDARRQSGLGSVSGIACSRVRLLGMDRDILAGFWTTASMDPSVSCLKLLKDAEAECGSFEEACDLAKERFLSAWRKAHEGRGSCPPAYGRMAATAWVPRSSLRFSLSGGPAKVHAASKLDFWLAQERFRQGDCRPELLVRLLDRQGLVCGAFRLFPDPHAMPSDALAQNVLERVATHAGNASGADILPGLRMRAASLLEDPARLFRNDSPQAMECAEQGAEFMRLAMLQSLAPSGTPRLNMWCSRAVSVTGKSGRLGRLAVPQDAGAPRRALLLSSRGAMEISPAFQHALQAEEEEQEDCTLSPAP